MIFHLAKQCAVISLILNIATSESNCNDLLRVRSEHQVPEIMLCIVIRIAEALCDIR